MFFIKMALKNVFRQYGRTALSMVSIIAGVAVLIIGRGFVGGMKENIIHAQVDTFSGHVMALPASYPDAGLQHPVDELLHVDPDTRAWLNDHTKAWTERTLFTPRIAVGPDAMRVRAFGFDPETDEAVFPRKDWRVEGSIPTKLGDGVLVSTGIAKVLNLKVGDSLVMEVRTSAGAINALDVKVAGLLATGSPMIDQIGVFVPKPLVQELVRTGDGFTHLAVRLADRDESEAFAGELESHLGAQARTTTWQKETHGIVEAQNMRQVMLDVIAFALVAIAATGIANTVLMAAYERVREIGTLRAMGMTQGGVLQLFLTEGLVMGVVGSALGALLGGWLMWKYSTEGIDLTPMIEKASKNADTYQNVPFSTMLYMAFDTGAIVMAVTIGLVVALVASIYPARLASDLAPADAVRAE